MADLISTSQRMLPSNGIFCAAIDEVETATPSELKPSSLFGARHYLVLDTRVGKQHSERDYQFIQEKELIKNTDDIYSTQTASFLKQNP